MTKLDTASSRWRGETAVCETCQDLGVTIEFRWIGHKYQCQCRCREGVPAQNRRRCANFTSYVSPCGHCEEGLRKRRAFSTWDGHDKAPPKPASSQPQELRVIAGGRD